MSLVSALLLFCLGLVHLARNRGPGAELRKLTEELTMRVEQEPEKIVTVYLCRLGSGSTAVKFRGEGRINFAGITGPAADELFARICQLAPHAERVVEPPDSQA